MERVNINELTHHRVSNEDCQLHHTRNMTDKMQHFLQDYRPHFEGAYRVLIERQPIHGLYSVEQLFLTLLEDRDALVQVHPTSMHKHFGIKGLTYDERKEKTVEIGRQYLSGQCLAYFEGLDRKHDISDAICLLLFHVESKRKEQRYHQRLEENRNFAIAVDPDDPDRENPFNRWACPKRPSLYCSIGKEPPGHKKVVEVSKKSGDL